MQAKGLQHSKSASLALAKARAGSAFGERHRTSCHGDCHERCLLVPGIAGGSYISSLTSAARMTLPSLRRLLRRVLQATVFDVTLHAGDALYLPACWYHAVSGGSGPNISFIHWCQLDPAVNNARGFRSRTTQFPSKQYRSPAFGMVAKALDGAQIIQVDSLQQTLAACCLQRQHAEAVFPAVQVLSAQRQGGSRGLEEAH